LKDNMGIHNSVEWLRAKVDGYGQVGTGMAWGLLEIRLYIAVFILQYLHRRNKVKGLLYNTE
jgi:hypothetical protein